MKKVGIYVRVSTVEQAEKGWSVEGQYRDIRAYCEKHQDWKVTWIFKDEGYSAADLNRPGIQNLLDRVQEGGLDILVVWRYDRLSRDNIDFPVLLHILEKHRVHLVSVNELSLDYNTPHGEFVIGMLGLIATLERRVMQTRVKMGMRERSRKGLWHGGIPPYGYFYDRSTGRLVQETSEASFVSKAFNVHRITGCLYATRDTLNTSGYTTRNGKKWTVPELRRLLQRETYKGVLRSSGIAVADPTLAIVDEHTFTSMQRLLEAEKPPLAGDGGLMKHQFGGKKDHPACPECQNKRTVRRRGKRLLVKGLPVQLYYCNICERTFDRTTSLVPLPVCPRCRTKREVQYYREWTSRAGVCFRVFGCGACDNRFRIPVSR